MNPAILLTFLTLPNPDNSRIYPWDSLVPSTLLSVSSVEFLPTSFPAVGKNVKEEVSKVLES